MKLALAAAAVLSTLGHHVVKAWDWKGYGCNETLLTPGSIACFGFYVLADGNYATGVTNSPNAESFGAIGVMFGSYQEPIALKVRNLDIKWTGNQVANHSDVYLIPNGQTWLVPKINISWELSYPENETLLFANQTKTVTCTITWDGLDENSQRVYGEAMQPKAFYVPMSLIHRKKTHNTTRYSTSFPLWQMNNTVAQTANFTMKCVNNIPQTLYDPYYSTTMYNYFDDWTDEMWMDPDWSMYHPDNLRPYPGGHWSSWPVHVRNMAAGQWDILAWNAQTWWYEKAYKAYNPNTTLWDDLFYTHFTANMF